MDTAFMRSWIDRWLPELERIEFRRTGCLVRVRQAIATKAKTTVATIENYRKRRLKRIADLYLSLATVVAVELQREADRLVHEALVARSRRSRLSPDERAALRAHGAKCLALADEDEALERGLPMAAE
jgi:hypothetical protein